MLSVSLATSQLIRLWFSFNSPLNSANSTAVVVQSTNDALTKLLQSPLFDAIVKLYPLPALKGPTEAILSEVEKEAPLSLLVMVYTPPNTVSSKEMSTK